jgi:RimJ/RimL family protein N-acetyltransferase
MKQAATSVLTFTFEVLGVQRLEARAAVVNRRGNGALRKIGPAPSQTLAAVRTAESRRGLRTFTQASFACSSIVRAVRHHAHRATALPAVRLAQKRGA